MNKKGVQLERVKEYFDNDALRWLNRYSQVTTANDLVLIERKNIMENFISRYVAEGTEILDTGCGAGVMAISLARQGYQVHGIDISKSMIELSTKLATEHNIPESICSFECSDLEKLVGKHLYGAVLAAGFLEYQLDEHRSLRQMSACLKAGGTLVCSGPNAVRLSNYFGLLSWARKKRSSSSHYPGLHEYTLKRFLSLLKDTGLEMLASRIHGFANFKYLDRLLGKQAERKLSLLLLRCPEWFGINKFGNDIVIVARKTGRI